MGAQKIEYAGLGTLQVRPFKSDLRHRHVLPMLTTRQAQVVALVRNGIHSQKEIGFAMGWTAGSTKTMLCLLYQRLQKFGYAVDNSASLAIFAFAPEVLKKRT
jgi:DNA-binding NarL/FixJ family response regulator